MNKHTNEIKQAIIARCNAGESISQVSKSTGVPRSTIHRWLKNTKSPSQKDRDPEKIIRQLESKIVRLEGLLDIIKRSNSSPTAPLKEKLEALETLYGSYNVHMLCEALDVSRGTFYNHIFRNKRNNTSYAIHREEIKVAIQKVFEDSNQIYGAGKIAAILKEQGYRTCEDTVRRLMHDMGLVSIRQRAQALYEQEKRITCKNILRQQFKALAPNKIWISDVTCFRYNDKNFYICAILDLFSRMVVGYRISFKNSTQLVKSTFKLAYEKRLPVNLIFHTDRGSNYRSSTFVTYLKSLKVIQSFSRAHVTIIFSFIIQNARIRAIIIKLQLQRKMIFITNSLPLYHKLGSSNALLF